MSKYPFRASSLRWRVGLPFADVKWYHAQPFAGVTTGRRFPKCRPVVKVPDARENGTSAGHDRRKDAPTRIVGCCCVGTISLIASVRRASAPGGAGRTDERPSPGGPVAAGTAADVGNPDAAKNDVACAPRPAAGRGDHDLPALSFCHPKRSPLRLHPAAL